MRNLFKNFLWFALCVLTGAASAATPATLEVDHHRSRVAVAVVTSVHNFVGELGAYEAGIHFNPGAALPDKADVAFDFKDLKTGNRGRDKDMLKWLKYASNPGAVFHLTGWKQDGTNSVALGELTMHGITRAVLMPTVIRHAGDEFEITGTAALDYQDFQLPVIRKALLFSVDPHLNVSFHLLCKPVDKT